MTHILIRAECRENEKRVGITPLEAKHLLKKGIKVSIEDNNSRIIPTSKRCKFIYRKVKSKKNNYCWSINGCRSFSTLID